MPTINQEGDTCNFDFYPEEAVEEVSNLTLEEREMFSEFDRILGRPVNS